MKALIGTVTITALIAVMVVLLSFGYFFLAGSGVFKSPESLQTQITQGLFGIVGLVVGYYFGSSKKDHQLATTESITKTTTNNEI